MAELTQDRLKELFYYDPVTGDFIRKVKSTCAKAGVCHCYDAKGYFRLWVNGRRYRLHRLMWFYMTGEWPDEIDHINHKRDDNRWCNLRNVSRSENQRNASLRKDNTSGYADIMWSKNHKKWVVRIQVNGSRGHHGYFQNIEDAVIKRNQLYKEHNFHPNHGLAA